MTTMPQQATSIPAESSTMGSVPTQGGHTPSAKSPHQPVSHNLAKLQQALQKQVFENDHEYQAFGKPEMERDTTPNMVNYWFATSGQATTPQEVFEHLHWGGCYIFLTEDYNEAVSVQQAFHDKGGFIIEQSIGPIRTRILGMSLPLLSKKGYYFIARKILLIPPGTTTERFTYHVQLAKNEKAEYGYVVLKEVPSLDNVVWRLKEKHPQLDHDVILKRARKLVESVFPIFLSRETAILNILQRDMPEDYRHRVPKVIGYEKDSRGFVRRLYLNWMRLGGKPMSQVEFAMQSADLLRALHTQGGMIHLDLRLDNIIISEGQVGFVDFGSAVRVGEDLTESPMLTTLFEEMMRTSQIQRLLGKWKDTGRVTSKVISDQHQRVDKAIDFFYLAVQMNRPHNNPEFRDQIHYSKESLEARQINNLTGSILRPEDPQRPVFRSASDILNGLKRIERRLYDANQHPSQMNDSAE
ncbi:MAG TPA: hypothetical protein DCM28_21890 [Phycisphaerales bacterium]|nr:hypothetical protein [Phycisphaerales bacterium]HCD31051.1 hypothetical protein [Phycisphaerales bacterium]